MRRARSIGESLGDEVFEVAGMVVLLPVLADARVDDRRAVAFAGPTLSENSPDTAANIHVSS
jgi:hypothetical protein